MRIKLLATVTVAVMLTSTACTSMKWMSMSKASNTYVPQTTSVSVRFVLPSEQERYAEWGMQPETQLAADSSYDGYSYGEYNDETMTFSPSAYHVALWGGSYDGTNVTTQATALTPGSYTFAYFDQPNKSVMQGWLDVRNTGSDLISVLNRWRDSVAEQKERLAYDLEIGGSIDTGDVEVFESFHKQMQECDRLQRRIEATISAEQQAQNTQRRQVRDLLNNADIRILPGDDAFFGPTTEPAFSWNDIDTVRDGEVVTKIVLVADFEEAQWKLRRLNQLYDDLSRFKEVLRQEADRLDRRKGLLLITDHLYDHDQRFVQNEMHLQYTLGVIARIQHHASDLRERRMALAFITSLFSPDGDFGALREEERTLFRERTVMETERDRLNQLFDEAEVSSPRRIALERSRQEVTATIETIDSQIQNTQQAHDVLAELVNSTDVIHRHNDLRLLTTTLVADRLPPAIRQIVEREATMTARLQIVDKVFAPRPTGVATTMPHHVPVYGNDTPTNNEGWPQQANTQPVTQDTNVTQVRFQQEPTDTQHADNRTVSQHPDVTRVRYQDEQADTDTAGTRHSDNWHADKRHPEHDGNDTAHTAEAPCRSNHSTKKHTENWNEGHHAQPVNENDSPTRVTTVSDRTEKPAAHKQTEETNRESDADKGDCPWYVKLLVWPCWIEENRSSE